MPSMKRESHFSVVAKETCEYAPNTFTEYESKRTGMRVVVVDQKGPKIQGFFALATEIHDDSGAPHTLEHLCFMGSKSYPYKGVLDQLATRAYSTTNAWTATDHTAYTLVTAGWAGFAQILPVYLEHVVVPTLTDAGCTTEVWHIDGEGNDAGVVYSEMQGVQNTQEELMDIKIKRLMYPEGVGFRSETGGMMEELRVLTADRIRAFHKEMYQPKNLCLVMVGEVDHEDMLQILDEFEETILDDIPKPDAPFKRPWVESRQPDPISKSITETIEFPEEDESTGEITVSYFGPSCTDLIGTAAMTVLLNYLCGSSISVLENTIVEKEHLASAIYYQQEPRPNALIQFSLSSVETELLEKVEKRFFNLLTETASKPFDMSYMKDCVIRQRRQHKYYAETTGSFFTNVVIADFLFRKRDGGGLKEMASLREYDEIEHWSDSQWRDFFKKWIAEAKSVTVIGKPSASMSTKIKAEEKARIETRKQELGAEGLEKLKQKLQHAKAENDKPVPKELLESFKVPDPSSIKFFHGVSASAGLARKPDTPINDIQKLLDADGSSPLFLHFEHIPSNFVSIHILLGTEGIPLNLRPLLPIYVENFFNTPLMRSGTQIPFETVVTELERDTVSFSFSSAEMLGNGEMLALSISLERSLYATGIRWLREMLWSTIFDPARIISTTTKLLADVPELKRSGADMTHAVAAMVNNAPESITRAGSTLVKALYLKRVKHQLKAEPGPVLAQLETLRTSICQPHNFRVLVIGNVTALSSPVSSWNTFTPPSPSPAAPLAPLDSKLARLSALGKNPGHSALIIPMPTSDSSYLLSTTLGPSSPLHPSIPALSIATAYLDAVEGPLWTAVRGTGLAYGTGFSRDTASGHIQFSVYRSPDAVKAFATARGVVEGYANGSSVFDEFALEGAISSIVLNLANSEETMGAAGVASFVRQVVKGLPRDHSEVFLKKVRGVGVEEIRGVMREVLVPVFEGERASVVVTVAPVMEENIVKGLTETGFKPEVRALASFQDDYGLKAAGDEIEEDEDEDEDEDMESGSETGSEESDE